MLTYRLFLSSLSVYKQFSMPCLVHSRGGRRYVAGSSETTTDTAGDRNMAAVPGEWGMGNSVWHRTLPKGLAGCKQPAPMVGLRKILYLRGRFFHAGSVSKTQHGNSHMGAVNLSHSFTFPNPSWPSKWLLQSKSIFASCDLKPNLCRWLSAWQRACSNCQVPFPKDPHGTMLGGQHDHLHPSNARLPFR